MLRQVHVGEGTDEYGAPREFFRRPRSLAQNTVLADLHLDLDSDARIVHGMLHLRQRPSASAVDVAWIGGGGTADLESDEGL